MINRFHGSWLALSAIVALAAMVRCQNLAALSYDFDEAFCWKMIVFPVGEIWPRSALDNHPPLYFYLLWGWARIFGDSPQALRSLSVLLGLATVVAAYFLVRESVGNALRGVPRTTDGSAIGPGGTPQRAFPTERGRPAPSDIPALAAAALVALSPLQVDWSQRVRMYVLGSALAVISSWLLLRALQARRPRWLDFGWYALAAAGLAYTHYFGLFVLAGQFLYAVGWLRAPDDAEHSQSADRPHPGPRPEGQGATAGGTPTPQSPAGGTPTPQSPAGGTPTPQTQTGGTPMQQVQVLSKSGAFPYFQGTAVMREEEYLSPEALARLPARQVWVIDAVDWIAPEWRVELSKPWVEVSNVDFPEWVSGSAMIVVRCHVKKDEG